MPCPQKIHVFLWLLVYNKVLTSENLNKRRPVEDLTCLFCDENESVQHLFFDCIVARHLWKFVAECFHMEIPVSFEDIGALWHMHKSKIVLNMVTAASFWSLQTLRNDFCFQGRTWRSLACVFARLRSFLQQWIVLCDATQSELLQRCILLLDKCRGELLRISWV